LGRFFQSIKNFPANQRGIIGTQANEIKQEIAVTYEQKLQQLKISSNAKNNNWLDVTLPGINPAIGHIHPLSLIEDQVIEIFHGMGFEIVESPEVENEWYNFDALNVPKDHPARDVFDSLFLNDGSILRPHTSPGQIRYMECHQPPLRIIMPGRVFRRDQVDASHAPNFYQIEGLMVDKDISVANFNQLSITFSNNF